MMRAFGVGGPSVDTVLGNPNTRPGLTLDGQVHVQGGDHDVAIERVVLGLVTRVEVEGGDSEYDATVEFHRVPVAGAFALAAGERRTLPFSFPVPWETPITDVYGQRLRGMTMGLRTELAVAKAVDKGDLDPVSVHPLPAQEAILDAFARLGFRFKNADLERGRIAGVAQTLPFYQEIEFYAAPQYAASVREVEVTFVASPQGLDVILEFDKRGGLFTGGHDAYGRFRVDHAGVDGTDWATVVDGWVREAAGRHASLLGGHGGHGLGGHGLGGPGFGGHGGHGKRGGHGFGAGAVAAGAAGGLLGGMILGEAVDEAGDAMGGDVGDFGGDFE
ncbi:MAG TPA: sporulation protein [Pilimelia sp.]|nr:sporulation protein [Pilimelia sp.]